MSAQRSDGKTTHKNEHKERPPHMDRQEQTERRTHGSIYNIFVCVCVCACRHKYMMCVCVCVSGVCYVCYMCARYLASSGNRL